MDFGLLDSTMTKFRELSEKTKLKNIEICYSNIEELKQFREKFQNIDDNEGSKKKMLKLIDDKTGENIDIIINESYYTFKDLREKENTEDELMKLVRDIQNSSFYEENKDRYHVKKMEIELIMVEAKKDGDYTKAKGKLIEIDKVVYYLELKELIKELIDICENNCVNKEHRIIVQLIFQQKFEEAYVVYEKLFNDYPNQIHLIYKEYLSFLDNVIMTKIARNELEIIEIEKYKNFVIKYKNKIEDYEKEIKKIKQFEKRKIWKNIEKFIEKQENEKERKINLMHNVGNAIKRSKESIDYYLDEIEKYVDKEEDLEEFNKTKSYIYEQIYNYENEERNNFSKSELWVSNRNRYKSELSDKKNLGAIYAYFNYLNKEEAHYDIRTIQLISLLILSSDLPKGIKGVYCKINTGEGKSTIILFFASYKVLLGNKVDIISSNQALAERDANQRENLIFYEKLKINVGALKGEDTNYDLDIIYGDSSSFSADILRQDFEFIPTRKARGYDVVIIDEVDSMCIDNLATKTQLTKNFPGYQSLYTFYYSIILSFCFIADEMKLTNDKFEINKKRDMIKKAILKRLKDNPSNFKNDLKNENDVKEAVKEYIVETKEKMENPEKKEENKSKDPKNLSDKKIQKLLNQDGKLFEVDGKNVAGILYPNFLKNEIEQNIELWIDSLITSVTMAENVDFRIIQEKTYQKILPIDFGNTGATQSNMVWPEGLHQILQIYNDIEVFPENTNTNYLYMMTYYKKYRELYGLTGTIGSKTNQEALQSLYNVKIYFIPPNSKSKLKKRTELVFTQKVEWENRIISEIKEVLHENRSVLLICISIKEGEKFEKLLRNNGINNIKKYFTEDDKEQVNETLYPNYVIIATNLAGRGTNINISESMEKAGGLHVIVSFLPINQRVEEQNYGRAGRKGQQGSYSLIFYYYDDTNDPLLSVDSIKKKRDDEERNRFKNFNENDRQNMIEEEKLFNDYCKYREKAVQKFSDELIKKDNEYRWGKIINSLESFEVKKKRLEQLKKSDQKIFNPLIKIQYYIQNVEKLEDDIKIFDEEKFYSWPLKITYANYLATQLKLDEALDYYKKAKENLTDYQIDIQNQTLLQLFIFKSLKKNEKIDLKEKQTKIGEQNTRKKKLLQVIIDMIEENEKVIEEYRKKSQEEKESIKIYRGLVKYVFQICEEKLNLKDKYSEEVKDLNKFSMEFGIDKFEFIRLANEPDPWNYYVVFITGVVELATGVIVSIGGVYLGNLKMVQCGIFLIRQGFNDVVLAFESAIQSKQINVKQWAGRKAIEYGKFVLKMIIGPSTMTPQSELISMITKEVAKTVGHYIIKKSVEYGYKKLLRKGLEKFRKIAGKNIGGTIVKHFTKKNNDSTKLIVIDNVNSGGKLFKEYMIAQTHEVCIFIRSSLKLFHDIIVKFSKINFSDFSLRNIFHQIHEMYPLIEKMMKEVKKFLNRAKGEEKDFLAIKKDLENKFATFDGTLRGLIAIKYNSGEEDTNKKIDLICIELIKYNVIKEQGEFDTAQINNKDLIQGYRLQINEEFKNVERVKDVTLIESKKKILGLEFKEMQECLNHLHEKSFCFDEENIKKSKNTLNDEIAKTVFEDMQYLLDMLCRDLVKKVKTVMNNFCENYEKKKNENKGTKKAQTSGKNHLSGKHVDSETKGGGGKRRDDPMAKQTQPHPSHPPHHLPHHPPHSPPHSPPHPHHPPPHSPPHHPPHFTPHSPPHHPPPHPPPHSPPHSPHHTHKNGDEHSNNGCNINITTAGKVNSGNGAYFGYSGYSGNYCGYNIGTSGYSNYIGISSYAGAKSPSYRNSNLPEQKKNNTNKDKEKNSNLFDGELNTNTQQNPTINDNTDNKTNNIINITPTDFGSGTGGGKQGGNSGGRKQGGNTGGGKQGGNTGGGKQGGNTDGGNRKRGKAPNRWDKFKKGAIAVGGAIRDGAVFVAAGVYNCAENVYNHREEIAYNTFQVIKDVDLENTVFKSKEIKIKKMNKEEKMLNELELKMLENKNKEILFKREYEKFQKKLEEKEKEEKKEKIYIEEGSKKWKKYKEEIRLQKLKEINYMDLVEDIVMNNYSIFKEKIIKETEKIYSQGFKEIASDIIREKHNNIIQSIKHTLQEIKSLNFMIAGFSGTGKSTLTNTILNINEAKESDDIDPETSEIKSYSNPNEFPGLTIYDTIGVESSNLNRNLSKMKDMIKEKFDENLREPDKALHGILYCIKNCLGDSRILDDEILYIKELNKMYGDGDIVTIVFTRSVNNKTESRKNQLREKLNNENIEIIEILCRDEPLFGMNIEAYGLGNLRQSMRNKAKNSLIKTNIKQVAKKKIKEKYLEDIKIKYKDLKKKLRQRKFESSFSFRLKYLIEVLFGKIGLDFTNIENIISNDIPELKKKIMKTLKIENDERIRKRINNEFINFNAKYDNLLKKNIDAYENYLFNTKFKDYLEPKVEEEIKNLLYEKSAILFMEKSVEILSDIVSEDIKDEEIHDLVDLNIKKFFQKDE